MLVSLENQGRHSHCLGEKGCGSSGGENPASNLQVLNTPHHSGGPAHADSGAGLSDADFDPSHAEHSTNEIQTQTPVYNLSRSGSASSNQNSLVYSVEGDSSHGQPDLHHKVSGGMFIEFKHSF